MTIEQIKAEAKKRFGQDLTDEQAEAILKSDGSEELSAKALEEVAGGKHDLKIKYVDHKFGDHKKPDVFEAFLGSLSSELLESYHFMWDKGYCDFEEVGPGDQSAFVQYLYEPDVPFMRINHAGFESANKNALSQLFNSPFYVVAYTTSGLATLGLWLDSLEDYEGAVDQYLTFVSQGMDTSLRTALQEAGMTDPFQEGAVKAIVDSVNQEFGLEKHLTEAQGHPFIDVVSLADVWYEDAVKYVYQQGIMVGTGDMKFSPNGTFDRGMLAAILWRQAGAPDLEEEIWGYPYKDVNTNAYYGTAVYWARLEGIASGVGGNRFAPSAPVTRQDFVTMLWRQAGKPSVDMSVLKRFRDQIRSAAMPGRPWPGLWKTIS